MELSDHADYLDSLHNWKDEIIWFQPHSVYHFHEKWHAYGYLRNRDCDNIYLCKYQSDYILSYEKPYNENIVFNMQEYGIHALKKKISIKLSKWSTIEENVYTGPLLDIIDDILHEIFVNQTAILSQYIDNIKLMLTDMKELVNGDNPYTNAWQPYTLNQIEDD
jgi:hypothetical protein